jgi:hypothetical protein
VVPVPQLLPDTAQHQRAIDPPADCPMLIVGDVDFAVAPLVPAKPAGGAAGAFRGGQP